MAPDSRDPKDADCNLSKLERQLGVLRERIIERVKMGESAAVSMEGLHDVLEELRVTQEYLGTARRRAGIERQRYRELFEFAPDGYIVTDSEGVVREANQAALEMLNMAPEVVVGRSMLGFLERSPGEEDGFFEAISKLREGEKLCEGFLGVRGRDREPILAHYRAAAAQHSDGRLEAVRWLLRDMSDQMRAQAEVEASREKLRELAVQLAQAEQRERRRIADGIHENAIQTLALAKMMLSNLGAGVEGTMREQLGEMAKIVGTAMDELRTLIFELSPPVLYELGLSPAVEWLADQMGKRYRIQMEVRSDLRSNALPIALRESLFHAIRELQVNVIKHSRAKRAVILMRQHRKMLRISVIDDGDGMERVSGADYRAGFGIFSVQNRIELMGGSFRIRTRKGRGTCVRMLVPLVLDGRDGKHQSVQKDSRDGG